MVVDVAAGLLAGPASGRAEALSEHLDRLGPVTMGGAPLMRALADSDLRGRGGAGFPTARKWQGVRHHMLRDGGAVVIGNGSEGEPCSRKDRWLLLNRPHLVLDGLDLAASAIGTTEIHLYLPHQSPDVMRAVKGAIRERRHLRRPRVRLAAAPPRYVAGEESAVVARIQGRPARPSYTPPRIFETGVWKLPTLVQNVETLARVALLARGRDVARLALVTVRRPDGSSLIDEIELGTPLATALARWLPDGDPAILIGGYFGRWTRPSSHGSLRLGTTELPLGAGVVAVLPEPVCPVAETARLLGYLAAESARQCGPCEFGLDALASAVRSLADPRQPRINPRLIQRWAGMVAGRGACHHPDGAVLMLRSAMSTFDELFAQHMRQGPCSRCDGAAALPTPTGGGWR